jgi:hypothetical protein
MSVQQSLLLDLPGLGLSPAPVSGDPQSPSSAIVGQKFGQLTVSRYEGAGQWVCACSACGGEHEVDREGLNRGFVCDSGGVVGDGNELRRRGTLKQRQSDKAFMSGAKFTAATSKQHGRTVERLNLRELHRSFWAGVRNDCLTLIEALDDGHWLCYCDRCRKLKIRKDSFLVKRHQDACGCWVSQQNRLISG